MLRTIIFTVVITIITILGVLITIPVGIVNPYSRINTAVIRLWSRILVWVAGIRLKVEGLENIQKGQSYIVIGNHQSHMDIPVTVTALPLPIRIMSKKELFKIPVFGWGMRSVGILEIDRSNRKRAIETLSQAEGIILKNRLSILAFPEGTRSKDGKIHAFKKGPFILAINTQLPVLPISISGTRKILPKGTLKLKGGKVLVKIHSPISTKGLTIDDRHDLLKVSKEIIESGFIENYG